MIDQQVQKRLEYLRGELRAERISYGEIAELQSLRAHILPGDVELLEAAGVPEAESDLDQRLTPYYESGERVEIEWLEGFEDFTGYGCRTEGKKARFYVGKSTGWKPVYLQILRRDSLGGAAVLSSAIKSIRGLGIYRHN